MNIIFTLLFFLVSGNSIRTDKTLLFIHHGSNVQINNIKYRETSTFSSTYFPIELTNTEYNISKTISINEIKNYKNYVFKSGLRDMVLYENKKTIKSKLETIPFSIYKDNTNVHIVGKFSAIPLTKTNSSLTVKLFINDLELSLKTSQKAFTFSYNKKISLTKGLYNLYFMVYSQKGIWCSCPEIRDGFYMSRFLSKWEYFEDKNPNGINYGLHQGLNILLYSLVHNNEYKYT